MTMADDRSVFDPELAAAIRDRREHVGLTQAEVAERLGAVGVSISRSNYANIETGRFPIRVRQIVGLDAVLALSSYDLDNHVTSADAIFGDATALAARLLDDESVDVPFSRSPAGTGSVAASESTDVDAALGQLFAAAQHAVGGDIYICGLPAGRTDKGALPARIRDELVHLMERGFQCTHLLKRGEDSFAPIALASSLLACENYRAFVIRPSISVPEFIVVRSEQQHAAAQILRDPQDVVARHAVVTREPRDVAAFEEFALSLTGTATPLLRFRSVSASPTKQIELTQSELDFYRAVTDCSMVGDWIAWSIGWLPNAFASPSAYERRIAQRLDTIRTRRDVGTDSVDEAVASELVALQRARHDNLLATLERRVPVQVLVTEKRLESFLATGTHHAAEEIDADIPNWRRFTKNEMREMAVELAALLTEFSTNLELRLTDNDGIERGLKTRKFEARGGKHGCVVLQTPAKAHGARSPVANMVLSHEVAAIGFKAIFDRRWRRARAVSADEVRTRLADSSGWTGHRPNS